MEMESRDAIKTYLRTMIEPVPNQADRQTPALVMPTRFSRGMKKLERAWAIATPERERREPWADQMADIILKNNGDWFVEQSLQAVVPQKIGGRGSAMTAYGYRWLWADIDVSEGVHKSGHVLPTLKESVTFLHEMELPPSWLIHSGGGLHAYWLLDQWIDVAVERTLPPLERVLSTLPATFQSGLKAEMGRRGWWMDSTGDLPRLLRIPGTQNSKREPVTVEFYEMNDRVYSLADVMKWANEHKPKVSFQSSTGRGSGKVPDWSATPEAVEEWLTRLNVEHQPIEPSQSLHYQFQWPVRCPKHHTHSDNADYWAHLFWREPSADQEQWHMGFKCQHLSHGGYGGIQWENFHHLVDPEWSHQQAMNKLRQARFR